MLSSSALTRALSGANSDTLERADGRGRHRAAGADEQQDRREGYAKRDDVAIGLADPHWFRRHRAKAFGHGNKPPFVLRGVK